MSQNVIYRNLSKIALWNTNLEYRTAVVPHSAIKKHRISYEINYDGILELPEMNLT